MNIRTCLVVVPIDWVTDPPVAEDTAGAIRRTPTSPTVVCRTVPPDDATVTTFLPKKTFQKF